MSFGLVVVLINTIVIWLLSVIFPNWFQVDHILWALVAGLVSGVLVTVFENLLGITPPIILGQTEALKIRLARARPDYVEGELLDAAVTGKDKLKHIVGKGGPDDGRRRGVVRRTSLDRMREDLRLQQVYNTLMRYGMDVVLERTPYVGGFRHGLQTWVWRLPKGWEEPPPAVRLRMMLEELGPTYVKIGQIVSSQASALPVDIAEELAQPAGRRAAVPQRPGARRDHRGAGGATGGAVRLVRAGAVRGRLHGAGAPRVPPRRHQGRRQGAAAADHHKVRSDLGILLNAARVASQRSEMVRTLDVSGMLEQFSSGVLEELDYRGETYNALQLAKNMEGLPGIHVPVIYTELSTSKIITQEFVEGVKVSDVESIEAAGLDREVIARNALRALIKQLPVDGFFHADPHPGNLLVNLDTGCSPSSTSA